MKKLFSLLQVAASALCLTMGIGVSAADQCGGCQTCGAAAKSCHNCPANCSGSGCLTCENIWDGYCASKLNCISSHRHHSRLHRSHQGCCPDNAGVGIYGCEGAPSRGCTPGFWQSLKSKFHNPFLYTSLSTGVCDVPPLKACDVPPERVCDAPPDCDCDAPATCDCDAPPSTASVGESEPDGVARDKPAAGYRFEDATVDPAAENSKAQPPTSPVVRVAPLPAEDPYPPLQPKDSSRLKTTDPFNWLKRTFSVAE